MSVSNGSRIRMESNASLSEFSPLVDVLENASVGGWVSGDVLGLGKNGENNSEGLDNAIQEDTENRHNEE